ncbi:MAG: dockerin type I repeat-containing protein, partial [Ruminococcus sp.]|nr:dockerin type I repeat-containing protein [Ruminococcus sp.]
NSDNLIDANDILLLQKHLLSSEILTAEQCKSADMNNDGNVNVFDMVLLRKLLIKQ